MRLALLLPLLAALPQPALAAVHGYDCTLRDAAAGWDGPQAIRLQFDPELHRATIADRADPDRVRVFASDPAKNYSFAIATDAFGDHSGTGWVAGATGFLDSFGIEAQTGRMIWIDMRLDLVPARTIWRCEPVA